jgi:GNAT superfamily N-acetyltransferase
MSKYNYITISRKSPSFKTICTYCDRKIVEENLSINGGTLNHSGIIHDSDCLIVCFDKTTPIGFNSLKELDECLYVYQIAIKKEHKQQGIGTHLMDIAISIAKKKEKPITAHVRDYNTSSNHLFQKLGFEVLEPGSNTLYVLDPKQIKSPKR